MEGIPDVTDDSTISVVSIWGGDEGESRCMTVEIQRAWRDNGENEVDRGLRRGHVTASERRGCPSMPPSTKCDGVEGTDKSREDRCRIAA